MTASTIKSHRQTPASAAFENIAVFIETLQKRVLDTLYTWQKRSRDRHQLRQLNARTLVDIGLRRDDIAREAHKPFWRA